MILLIHKNNRVEELIDLKTNKSIKIYNQKPVNVLFNAAKKNTERIIVWCHKSLKENLNIEGLKILFCFKNMMLSYSVTNYIPNQIGYIEDSPFLKVNKKVRYPTWLMSSQVGAIYGSQLLKFENKIEYNNSFDFVLNVIAKKGMSYGLFCYSEPRLLTKLDDYSIANQIASSFELFKFVKQHYKNIWHILLLFNFIINDRKFPVLAFLRTFFYSKKDVKFQFDFKPLIQNKTNIEASIDVIIPTIGRKEYLYNVLIDLSNQTQLPKQVIIVEQNENVNSKTELDYITNKSWPFVITHKFIHKTGACNARNVALKEVTANYVYLADDDNKFNNNLIEDIVTKMQHYNLDVITMSYLQESEMEIHNKPIQWSTFGGGSSVIASKLLDRVSFNMALEFGYGEDTDFGIQLRNQGADIIYFPEIKIHHLKAPIGGFRTPFVHPWKNEDIQPKPSPTVMLNRLNNYTEQQLLGYRTKLFIKFYKNQNIKSPIKYFKRFKAQWTRSQFWANKLKEQYK